MRVAILHHTYGRFGGAERVTLSHYDQLKRMNRDVSLYYGGLISDVWLRRLDPGEVRHLPRTSDGLPAFSRLVAELSEYDKILIHHHIDPAVAFFLTKFLGRKIVWYMGSLFELAWERQITGLDYRGISTTVRGSGHEFYGRVSDILLSRPVYGLTVMASRTVDTSSVRGCSRVLTNSVFLAKQVKRVYRLSYEPEVVYPGVDQSLVDFADRPRRVVDEDFLLYVGALIPLKNVGGIIDASKGLPIGVVMVGDGQERAKLVRQAAREHVRLDVRSGAMGENELANAYSRCKFLVHLSLYEPFGLTPIEAALFQKTSIVTNRGGPAETVIDGETGYVVDPEDTRLVASRMSELLEEDGVRREMASKARKAARGNFTVERSTRELVATLES